MKIIDMCAAELTFNPFKLGFYYQPYSEHKWIRLNNCFTWTQAKNKLANIQINKYLER